MTKRPAKSIAPHRTAKQFAPAVPPPQALPVTAKPAQLLDRKQVMARVNLTYPTLWMRMRKGNFPRSRNCGGKIMWLEDEIENWIRSRPPQVLKGDEDAAS